MICGNETLDRSTVQWLHKRFREGKMSTEENPQSSCPSTVIENTSTIIIATVLDKDWRIIVRETDRNWNTLNYSSLYFNWTFVQEKSGCAMSIIYRQTHKNKHISKSCKNI